MAEQISFKERVRQILISSSRQYKYYYTDYEYLLCSPAFKQNPYYIVTAEEDNFLHLTGVLSHISPQKFFDKCFNGTLSEDDFEVSGTHKGQDLKGTIRRKINVIPNIFGIFSSSTTVQEDFQKNRISCSFATGNITCTLGFAGVTAAHPKTLLKGNELDPEKSSNLLIVLRRSSGKNKFGELLVGGTEELLNYYGDLKPLLSDKIVSQMDRIIGERKTAPLEVHKENEKKE